MLKKFILLASLSFFAITCYSQDSLLNKKIFEDYINAIAFMHLEFLPPDRNFELLNDSTGYQCLERTATIKYTFIPGTFKEVVKEMREQKSTEDILVIDTLSTSFKNVQAFILVEENIAPKSSGFENFISLFIVVPLKDNVTVAVIGAYPKSQDANLRKKYIVAALTIKEKS